MVKGSKVNSEPTMEEKYSHVLTVGEIIEVAVDRKPIWSITDDGYTNKPVYQLFLENNPIAFDEYVSRVLMEEIDYEENEYEEVSDWLCANCLKIANLYRDEIIRFAGVERQKEVDNYLEQKYAEQEKKKGKESKDVKESKKILKQE